MWTRCLRVKKTQWGVDTPMYPIHPCIVTVAPRPSLNVACENGGPAARDAPPAKHDTPGSRMVTDAGEREPTQRRERTRQRLLDAAAIEFAVSGLDAASV